MTNTPRFQVLRGVERRYGAKAGTPRASLEMRRAAVMSFEQLVSGTGESSPVARTEAVLPDPKVPMQATRMPPQISATALARDPRAHPAVPPRPQAAARNAFSIMPDDHVPQLAQQAQGEAAATSTKGEGAAKAANPKLSIDPEEPAAEPQHRGAAHGAATLPERSRLSPSQRAASKRPALQLDRNGRPAFITYTVDATGNR